MSIHPLGGKPAPPELLIDVGQFERAADERGPDLSDPDQLVSLARADTGRCAHTRSASLVRRLSGSWPPCPPACGRL